MKLQAWHFDAAMAVLFMAACSWVLRMADEAAADAVRQYGRNVDSGAIQYGFATTYLMPIAALFSVAAVCGLIGWRLGRYVHWLAITAAAFLFALSVFAALFH